MIQVLYIPANRDPAQELRYAARTGLGRLVRAISWADATHKTVKEASETIRNALTAERGIVAIDEVLQSHWQDLIDEHAANTVSLKFAGAGIEELVREFGVTFVPGEDGRESDLSGLSDGQQSLFYLALVGAVSNIEGKLLAEQSSTSALTRDVGGEGKDALGGDTLAPQASASTNSACLR